MIAITDVSSRIGSALALSLLHSGEQVRGIDTKREQLAFLKSEKMELAIGEQNDPVFLASAFKDAHTLFLVIPSRPDMEDFRKVFDETGDAVVKGIRDSKIRTVFMLSSMGVDETGEAGLILGLRDVEARLNLLTIENIIYLRPGYFMEHFLSKIIYIKTKDMILDSTDGERPLYMVCTDDVANKAFSMYKEGQQYGRSVVELYGERLSYHQATKSIAEAINIPELPYIQLMDSEMRNDLISRGFSINMANAYVEMSHALSRGAVSPKLIDTEVPNCPTRFSQFVNESFIPAYKASAT